MSDIGVPRLFTLSVRLLVKRRLYGVMFWGSQEVIHRFSAMQRLAPQSLRCSRVRWSCQRSHLHRPPHQGLGLERMNFGRDATQPKTCPFFQVLRHSRKYQSFCTYCFWNASFPLCISSFRSQLGGHLGRERAFLATPCSETLPVTCFACEVNRKISELHFFIKSAPFLSVLSTDFLP